MASRPRTGSTATAPATEPTNPDLAIASSSFSEGSARLPWLRPILAIKTSLAPRQATAALPRIVGRRLYPVSTVTRAPGPTAVRFKWKSKPLPGS